MAQFELITDVSAPPAVCFDLSRDIDFHKRSLAHTGEEAVAGCTTGLIGLGDEVTWRGKHFGLWHLHTAKITAFDRPHHFRDEMTRGRFRKFVHDHHFEAAGTGTRIRDVLEFQAPLGLLGTVVETLFLRGYLERLIKTRNEAVRDEAETR